MDNQELSWAYFRVAAGNVENIETYKEMQRKIAAVEASFTEYFKAHRKSLKGLKIDGISTKTLTILEDILREGEARAIELLQTRRDTRPTAQSSRRGRPRDEETEGFDPLNDFHDIEDIDETY